ncbi:hypothetical protein H0H87_009551 [Tephrocybe sp. NHM501043]|nr:hypothetical protein H0H87_009551 [Tephrocybe sp. NHM501043]
MFSFRNAFFLAAAALATVTSAAPTGNGGAPGVNQVAQLVGVHDVLNGVAHDVSVHDVDVTVADLRRHNPEQVVNGQEGGLNADGSISDLLSSVTGGLKTRDDAASLPELLVDAKAKLEVVLANLNGASNGKPNVDVNILVDIVGQVQVILCGILDGVKVIVGHPIEFILCLEGKVLAIVDVCALLTTVLSLVCIILSCVLRLVASASIHIVAPLVAGIGAVLCELLTCIFKLVPGIAAGLLPTVGPIINLLIALKLEAVVNVLKAAN